MSVPVSHRRRARTVDGSLVETRVERSPLDGESRVVLCVGGYLATMTGRQSRALGRRLVELADKVRR